MASSLEKLGKTLNNEQKNYTLNYIRERFSDKLNDKEMSEMINKGKFPYSWFDSLSKLDY